MFIKQLCKLPESCISVLVTGIRNRVYLVLLLCYGVATWGTPILSLIYSYMFFLVKWAFLFWVFVCLLFSPLYILLLDLLFLGKENIKNHSHANVSVGAVALSSCCHAVPPIWLPCQMALAWAPPPFKSCILLGYCGPLTTLNSP